MIAIHYDYVIVGAGSAGCVLAGRLSEDFGTRVLLVEAGPIDGSISLEMPLAFPLPLRNSRYNWNYYSEPEPHIDQRRVYCPQGRVLGGSSAINAMIWQRGNPLDYDGWAARGLPEWSYADCLPYFKKSEARARGADDYRGNEGPMRVATGACENPLHQAFLEAAGQAGYSHTDDMNGYQQEGFGPADMTVHRGRRWSTARGYLDSIRGRENFKRELESTVLRLLFDGRKAVGIEYERMGIIQKVFAEKEVILCAGSFNTPQLMQLSGVGPADHLRSLDVPVVADVPGVGGSLQNHSELSIQYECSQPVSISPATAGFGRVRTGLTWLLARRGAGASTQFEAGGFIRSRAGIEYPDLQLRFLPVAGYHNSSHSPSGHGYQATVSLLRPTSEGQVRLHSLDPRAAPAILFNFGATAEDRTTMREGVRLTREILQQSAFEPFRGAQLAPGPQVESNADIDAFVRAKLGTSYHPSSTCRMGVDDGAVVSSEGFVYGVESLRVVDASILPSAISANLNATVIMMAERFADKILGKPQLPALDAPFHRSSGWERSQR